MKTGSSAVFVCKSSPIRSCPVVFHRIHPLFSVENREKSVEFPTFQGKIPFFDNLIRWKTQWKVCKTIIFKNDITLCILFSTKGQILHENPEENLSLLCYCSFFSTMTVGSIHLPSCFMAKCKWLSKETSAGATPRVPMTCSIFTSSPCCTRTSSSPQ